MSKITVIGIVGQTIFMEVDHFHREGETLETEKAHFEYGAKGFNQALAAARMGAEVSFISPVGEDIYNDIDALCKEEGIMPCLVKKAGNSSFGCVLTDKSGANRVSVFKGVNLCESDIDAFENEIKSSDILLLNNELPEAVNLRAASIAKEAGVKVILNPAPYRKTSKELLDSVYLFTPNECEAEGLEDYKNVIQTLGKNGCFIKPENKLIPSIKVKAVDTTGAGDTFNGVLAADLSVGKPVSEAVKIATVAAGISVTRKGAASSVPYRKEIELFLEEK